MESAAWAAVDGIATNEQLALLEADAPGWRRALERLLDDTEDNLDAVRDLSGPERDQVVADLEAELERLELAYDRLTGASDAADAVLVAPDPAGEVRLQASWSADEVVVWAAGPDTVPASHDDLSDRLEGIGGPAVGWNQHRGVPLPTGDRAAALSIPVADALGWLVAVGGGLGGDGVGSSVTWLGRVAVYAVRLVARGAIVPTLRSSRRPDGRTLDLHVRWVPADVDHAGGRRAGRGHARARRRHVAGRRPAVTLERARRGRRRHRLRRRRPARAAGPAAGRPHRRRRREAVITRLDGSAFVAPVAAGAEVVQAPRALGQAGHRRRAARGSSCSSTRPTRATPGSCRCSGRGAEGGLLPIELALTDSRVDQAPGRRARPPRAPPTRCCCGPAASAGARST